METITGARLTSKGRAYLRWRDTVHSADEMSPSVAFAAGWEACRQAMEEGEQHDQANPDTPLHA